MLQIEEKERERERDREREDAHRRIEGGRTT
jgi:hypothetical protein